MSVFDDAEAFWHAGLYRGSGDLLDLTDNGHDAVISGAKHLDHAGMNYVHMPTAAANENTVWLTYTPDPNFTLIEYVAKVRKEDWIGTAGYIGGGQSGRRLFLVEGSGVVAIYVLDASVVQRNVKSSVSTTGLVSDGGWLWLKATWDSSGGVGNFYYSQETALNDPALVTWVQLGAADVAESGSPVPAYAVTSMSIGNSRTGGSYAGFDGDIAVFRYRENGVTVQQVMPSDIDADSQATINDSTPTYYDGSGGADSGFKANEDIPNLADIVADMDVRCRISSDNYQRTGADSTAVSIYSTTGAGRVFRLGPYRDSSERIYFYCSDGTSTSFATSDTTAGMIVDGKPMWIRATFVAGIITYYYSYDDTNDPFAVSWTSAGTDDISGTFTSLNATPNTKLVVGNSDSYMDTTAWFDGQVHRAWIGKASDLTTYFDLDLTTLTNGDTAATDTEGVTLDIEGSGAVNGGPNDWIVNRGTSGYTTHLVTQSVFAQDGVDDAWSAPDHADLDLGAGDDATVLVAVRPHYLTGTNVGIMNKYGGGVGWSVYVDNSGNVVAVIDDGPTLKFDIKAITGWELGFHVLGFRIDRTAQTIEAFSDGVGSGSATDISAVGSLANSAAMQFGVTTAQPAGTGGLFAGVFARRVFTDDEMLEASQRLADTFAQTEPELKLEIAFDDDPFAASPVWTDVSAYARSLQIQRGAGSAERDDIRAGVASFVLNNHDARFSPWNTVHNMKPMSRVRAKATWQAIPYPLFDGYLESVDVDWLNDNYSTAVLRAVDAFKLLAYFNTATSQVEEATGTRIGNWLDDASWPAAWRYLDSGAYSAAAHDALCEEVLGLIRKTVALEDGGRFFISRDGFAIFHDGAHVHAPGGTYSDDQIQLPYKTLDLEWNDAQIWNEVTATATDGSALSSDDATSIATYGKRTLKWLDVHAVDATDLQAQADALVAKYKDPQVMIRRLVVNPRSDTRLWTRVLGDDLGQPITVERQPSAGPKLSQALNVRGYSLTAGPKQWQIIYDLAP